MGALGGQGRLLGGRRPVRKHYNLSAKAFDSLATVSLLKLVACLLIGYSEAFDLSLASSALFPLDDQKYPLEYSLLAEDNNNNMLIPGDTSNKFGYYIQNLNDLADLISLQQQQQQLNKDDNNNINLQEIIQLSEPVNNIEEFHQLNNVSKKEHRSLRAADEIGALEDASRQLLQLQQDQQHEHVIRSPLYVGGILEELLEQQQKEQEEQFRREQQRTLLNSLLANNMIQTESENDDDRAQQQATTLSTGSEFIDPTMLLVGHQYVQGGAGEGRQLLGPEGTFENVQVIKTDHAVPSYCNPPNPCPIGYTAADGCLENFINSASFSREYQAKQKCSCDNEHSLFNCAVPPLTSGNVQSSKQLEPLNSLAQGMSIAGPETNSINDQELDGTTITTTNNDNKLVGILARTINNRFGNLASVRNLISSADLKHEEDEAHQEHQKN